MKYLGNKKSLLENVDELLSGLNSPEGEILYLNPPYTNVQYDNLYHLLENIALGDEPVIGEVAGLPVRDDVSSLWLRDGYAHVAFENVISQARSEHIILSYSSAGHMSREFIENVLRRHGDPASLRSVMIPCKQYLITQTSKKDTAVEHYEYLFYVHKPKGRKPVYSSPINYTGNKAPLAGWLRNSVEEGEPLGKVYDVFGGGLNAGINLGDEGLLYNDINFFVVGILEWLRDSDTAKVYRSVKQSIKRFGLSANNKEAYLLLREAYNKPSVARRDPKLLFLLILYGFQHQLRFNNSHQFNNPVGLGSFNDSVLEKLVSFSRVLKEREVEFKTGDYQDAVLLNSVNQNDLVYLDPPYLITLGSYNDGKREASTVGTRVMRFGF